ncbi:MAG: hypothetical protein JHC93_03710 [Parachlamydiales bacterium]|nr:hypothetical protein [Parachlamydiales bacterium]
MLRLLQDLYQKINGLTPSTTPQKTIIASTDNLLNEIECAGLNSVTCLFKEHFQTYTPLEYAIKSQCLEAISKLLYVNSLNSNAYFKEETTIIHFYISCLDEHAPNTDILNVLVQHFRNWNKKHPQTNLYPVEQALKHMHAFQSFHWSVIEILFKHDRIINKDLPLENLFSTLVSADNHKIVEERFYRTFDEEKTFLMNLIYYADLEKKYFPDSYCKLPLELFLSHSGNFTQKFSKIADDILTIKDLILKRDELLFMLSETNDQSKIYKQIQDQLNLVNDKIENLHTQCTYITTTFSSYHYIFKKLVSDSDFIDCFDDKNLKTIINYLDDNKESSSSIKILLDLLKSWGLIPQ